MASPLTLRSEAVQRALEAAKRSREMAGARLAAFKAANAKSIARGTRTIEVVGTSVALGAAAEQFGKDGRLEVAGIPISLAVGLASHVLGFVLSNDKDDELLEHLHACGDGALAAYASAYSRSWFHKSDRRQGTTTTTSVTPTSVTVTPAMATPPTSTTAGANYPFFNGYARALPPPQASYAPPSYASPPSYLTADEATAMMQGIR